MKTWTIALGVAFFLAGLAQAGELVLAGPGQPAMRLHGGIGEAQFVEALEPWQVFAEQRGLELKRLATQEEATREGIGALLAFETLDNPAVANAAGPSVEKLDGLRPEAYLLVAREWQGQPLVLVVGKTDAGLRAGAAQLFSLIHFWEGVLSVEAQEKVYSPFIKGREATLTPTGRILRDRPDLMRKLNYELWTPDQLQDLVHYVWASGFNSLQIMELLRYRDGAEREAVAPVLHTLARTTRERGMTVSQYIWGSADGFRWDDPQTRPKREARYEGLAATYGEYVDHIISHWIDEGEEGGYVTPQEATVYLWEAYKKYNPEVLATFDTWGNDERSNAVEPGGGFWDQSDTPGFLDETFSPREIGVALERWWDPARAALVKQAGRRLGIWGWYLGDYEMIFASHLQTRVLAKYFASLTPEAGEAIDWLSIERTFHGVPADVNWYVTGQLMWEPKRAVEDILYGYCRAVYGPPNVDTMVAVYTTVEEGQEDFKYYGYFIPESDKFPRVVHTAEYQQKAAEALERLGQVQLPEGWQANFPVLAMPQEYIDSLKRSLEALSQGEYPIF